MSTLSSTIKNLSLGDQKTLARCITAIENETEGYEKLLFQLPIQSNIPIIGITGPPGAGKSTLLNGIIKHLLSHNPTTKIGLIVIDPSSPFHHGALLGDRIRMSEHFTHPNVFIRSLATRGALGGLSAKTIEITDIMRSAGFDYIFIETVGVGQSEIEIASLADVTILVLVPEAGDEVQTLKAGVMEIADIFVVNKADREDAHVMLKNLHELVHATKETPILKTVATTQEGIENLVIEIKKLSGLALNPKKQSLLLTKAIQLILQHKMKTINTFRLQEEIKSASEKKNFNLYVFVREWLLQNTN